MESCPVTSFTLSCKQVGSIKHVDDFEQLHSLISGSFSQSHISHNLVYKLRVNFFSACSIQFMQDQNQEKKKIWCFFFVFNLRKCCMMDSSFSLLSIGKLLHSLHKIVFLAAVH